MKKAPFLIITSLIILGLVSGCGTINLFHKKTRLPEPSRTAPHRVVGKFEGTASWYGPKFHGKKTASGEIFDMYELTAAHKTLPLGTMCVVTNRQNGKSVTVRINDRGPYIEGRVIDLSYAAAMVIDMVESGTVPVRVEILAGGSETEFTPLSSSSPFSGEMDIFYTIQVGSFTDRTNAETLHDSLIGLFDNVRIEEFKTSDTTYYRVRVGKFPSRDKADIAADELSRSGYSGFITEM
jgi:rare lipoprotein A